MMNLTLKALIPSRLLGVTLVSLLFSTSPAHSAVVRDVGGPQRSREPLVQRSACCPERNGLRLLTGKKKPQQVGQKKKSGSEGGWKAACLITVSTRFSRT
nr:hypothetical protein [Pseudomonas luteola]